MLRTREQKRVTVRLRGSFHPLYNGILGAEERPRTFAKDQRICVLLLSLPFLVSLVISRFFYARESDQRWKRSCNFVPRSREIRFDLNKRRK